MLLILEWDVSGILRITNHDNTNHIPHHSFHLHQMNSTCSHQRYCCCCYNWFRATEVAFPGGQVSLVRYSILTSVSISVVIWAGRWVSWRTWESALVSNHWSTFGLCDCLIFHYKQLLPFSFVTQIGMAIILFSLLSSYFHSHSLKESEWQS